MNSWISLEDIQQATNAKVITLKANKFYGVGTDTRKSLKDQLFVALKGENFDAHDYLNQAVEAGASGLLIHVHPETLSAEQFLKFNTIKDKVSIFLVSDTLQALQKLGQHRRRQWGKPLIAITGSNGKTTTKEFTAQLISQYKQVHYNQGSFNNHWGLPLTLLGLQPHHDVAICEMGMNHSGEISALVKIAEPHIVGVTMVGRAHLEGLGSIEAVARAKEEIYESILTENPPLRIFNLDNEWTLKMFEKYSRTLKNTRSDLKNGSDEDNEVSTIFETASTLSYSSQNTQADVQFQIQSMTLEHITLTGKIKDLKGSIIVPVFGKQNAGNLMFAACSALAVGLSPEEIWKALPQCKTIWGRNQKLHHSTGAEILFDGYNANPDSQKALIENLKLLHLDRPLIGVFGEMRELGSHSEKLHEELGGLVATAPFTQVYFVGNFGNNFKTGYLKQKTKLGLPDSTTTLNEDSNSLQIFPNIDSNLINLIENSLTLKPIITIKGSRGVKLERILNSLHLI